MTNALTVMQSCYRMGLDLVCGNRSFRFGSYGYVHRQRLAWIRANMMHVLNGMSDMDRFEKDRVRAIWSSCWDDRENLDYKYIRKVMRPYLMEGVWTFVYHSDAEGVWTPEDAKHMLDALGVLRREFEAMPCMQDVMLEKKGNPYYFLEPLLRYSWIHGQDILFC